MRPNDDAGRENAAVYHTHLASYADRPSQPAVRVRGVVKTFGTVHALRGVDLDLLSGEVHGLVGANGAGKSTLVKIISGALSQDAGSVEIASCELGWTTLAAHRQAGVATLYQETTIVPNMSAMVNAFLGRFRHRGPLMAKNQMRRDFQSFCEQLGLSIDPDTPAGLLPVTTQRMLEIIRA
jgi:ribose transport system ATP-binding protein